MLNEVKALEAQLKQILYGCVEHVQATKAALYLSATHDLNDKTYEIATSYQFNDARRRVVTSNDDLVDRLVVKRTAFFVNGLGTDPRFSEMLFRQSTDRILAAPMFARGRLIGFIDMRDKAAKKPFDPTDLDAAKKITDEVVALLAAKKLFGVGPVALSEHNEPARSTLQSGPFLTIGANAPATPAPQPSRGNELSEAARRAIEIARETMAKRQLDRATSKHVLTEQDLDGVRLLLPATLAINGVVFAALTVVGHPNNPQTIVAGGLVDPEALDALHNHVQPWLKRINQPNASLRPTLVQPFGVEGTPVSASRIVKVLSAPVTVQSVDGLLLTVAFDRPPDPQAQRQLALLLRQFENAIDVVVNGAGKDRQLLAEKLLEPDFQRYPELVDHSRQVSVLAQRLAIALELSAPQVETVRLAGLVHDVGLRLLDYERLYKRPTLTAEELRGLAEHPIVGAALVEPILGSDVAQAVLRHHERVDGKGYPSRMGGQSIPIASRIIQVCDAWVAMTSTSSYQQPTSREDALTKLRSGAGTQFDEAVVARFIKSLAELGA